MGSCCSKRDRQSDGAANVSLHPSLENWRTHHRSQPSELRVVADGRICMRDKLQGPPSVHYATTDPVCESNYQSLGKDVLLQLLEPPQPCNSSQSASQLSDFSDLISTINHCGHHSSIVEPEDEPLPTFSFAEAVAVQTGEANLFNNVAFESNHTRKLGYGVNIDNSDGIKLEVRHKHMFPRDVQGSTINFKAPHEEPVMKGGKTSEKLFAGDQEESQCILHCRSFQEAIAENGLRCENEESMLEFRKGYAKEGGIVNDSPQLIQRELNEDNDEDFHDITVGVSIASFHANHEKARKEMLDDIKHCISMEVSSHSKSPSIEQLHANDGVNHHPSSEIFEFKQSVYVLSQENMQFISREEKEWQARGEGIGGKKDKVNRMQPFSVVSTGDAILFSGSNSDEFHLIPSKFVQHQQLPRSPPKENLSPPRLITTETHEQRQENSSLSVEDIILLLENDELNEDDLLSLLIKSKSSSESLLQSSSSSSSSLSSSSLSSSSSSMPWSLSSSSSSSSLSSSSSMPWSSSSSSSSSSSLSSSSSMPWLPSSSTASSSLLPYSLSQSSSCKMSSQSSLEFKVKSCNSTISTPMFSPIRSRTKVQEKHCPDQANCLHDR